MRTPQERADRRRNAILEGIADGRVLVNVYDGVIWARLHQEGHWKPNDVSAEVAELIAEGAVCKPRYTRYAKPAKLTKKGAAA